MYNSKLEDFLGLTETCEGKDTVRIDGICIDKYIAELIVSLNKLNLKTTSSCSGLNEDHEDCFDDRHDGYISIVQLEDTDPLILAWILKVAEEEGFHVMAQYHPWLRKPHFRIGTISKETYHGEEEYDNDKIRKAQWDSLLAEVNEFIDELK